MAVIAITAVCVWMYSHKKTHQGQSEDITHTTNGYEIYNDDIPPADSRFVGRWQCADDMHWHKVYYDDYDANGYYWGKEWHEDENVKETDLIFHGNGWFKWKIENKTLHEMHCMDVSSVTVPKQYIFNCKEQNVLQLTDKFCKNTSLRFTRQ